LTVTVALARAVEEPVVEPPVELDLVRVRVR
jgi:hypothetical protein